MSWRLALVVSLSTWPESVEYFLDLGSRLPRARREPRDDRQEAVACQCLQLEVAGCRTVAVRGTRRSSAISPNPSLDRAS
jgi:hypothetical protein